MFSQSSGIGASLGRASIRLLFCITLAVPVMAHGQETPPASSAAGEAPVQRLTVGDPAPALEVEAYLKGDPIAGFQPGHVYVVDFWATWCQPCAFAIPRLRAIQERWADKVTVVSVDVWEGNAKSPYTEATRGTVAAFVSERDSLMDYHVAYDGAAARSATAWLKAADLWSIPQVFVVDGGGRLAYIGSPFNREMDGIMAEIVAGSRDLVAARAAYEEKRESNKAEAIARKAANSRMDAAVAVALPLIRSGRYAEGVACLDTLDGVAQILGADARDQAKARACRSLFAAGDVDVAHGYLEHLLAANALTSAIVMSDVAWIIVDPDRPVAGADPAQAVLFCERALAGLEPEIERFRSVILDMQARGLWATGDRVRALAVQEEAVRLEADGAFGADMRVLLDTYRREGGK